VHRLVLSFVTSSIIFLYLLDNEASKLVLVSSASNLMITGWKLIKILRLSCARSRWGLPTLQLGESNRKETKTQEFDRKAMTYLGYAMIVIQLSFKPCLETLTDKPL
jgi:hypothetical protein